MYSNGLLVGDGYDDLRSRMQWCGGAGKFLWCILKLPNAPQYCIAILGVGSLGKQPSTVTSNHPRQPTVQAKPPHHKTLLVGSSPYWYNHRFQKDSLTKIWVTHSEWLYSTNYRMSGWLFLLPTPHLRALIRKWCAVRR